MYLLIQLAGVSYGMTTGLYSLQRPTDIIIDIPYVISRAWSGGPLPTAVSCGKSGSVLRTHVLHVFDIFYG